MKDYMQINNGKYLIEDGKNDLIIEVLGRRYDKQEGDYYVTVAWEGMEMEYRVHDVDSTKPYIVTDIPYSSMDAIVCFCWNEFKYDRRKKMYVEK